MIRYFYRTVAAHLRSSPVLYTLTALGVALGVASVVSIQLLNQSAIASFSGSLRAIDGDADILILGETGTFSERVYTRVLGEPDVAAAWPIYRARAAVSGHDGLFLKIIGLDLVSAASLPLLRALRPESSGPSGHALLETPGMAISPALSGQVGWEVGDTVEVTSGARRVDLQIQGILDLRHVAPGASRTLALMDIAQAQGIFGGLGRLHEIGVRAREGISVTALAKRMGGRLGPGLRVVTPAQRTEEARSLLGAFRLNLTALSLVSLVVGAFLVFSSMQACLIRQRPEFGLLRCLGATPLQILGLILGEALLVGTVGILLGIPAGYWTARANLDAVSGTLTSVYVLEEIESVDLSFEGLTLGMLVGMGGALAGTLLPALDLSRRETRDLLDGFSLTSRALRYARPLFWAGVCLLTLAGMWYGIFGRSWRPSGFVLAAVVLLALPMGTPFLVQRITGSMRAPDFGFVFGLKSLAASLPNTSVSVAALSMAVCLLVGMTLLVESFRRTLDAWVKSSLRADIYITTETGNNRTQGSGLSTELVSSIETQPGVERVDTLQRVFVNVAQRSIPLAGVDLGTRTGEDGLVFLAGEARQVFRDARRLKGVLVGEPLAHAQKLRLGDSIEFGSPAGPVSFPVIGIYADYTEGGSMTMDRSVMEQTFGLVPIHSLAVFLEKGVDAATVTEDLRSRFSGVPLLIRTHRALRTEILRIFDQTFAVTGILEWVCLLIAVSAITLTLIVIGQEKRREIALYQTLGAYRSQIVWLFMNKGLSMAFLGIVLGSLAGLALGYILIFSIQKNYFGWSIQWSWPWLSLAEDFTVVLFACLVSSLYPALRASQTTALELREEEA